MNSSLLRVNRLTQYGWVIAAVLWIVAGVLFLLDSANAREWLRIGATPQGLFSPAVVSSLVVVFWVITAGLLSLRAAGRFPPGSIGIAVVCVAWMFPLSTTISNVFGNYAPVDGRLLFGLWVVLFCLAVSVADLARLRLRWFPEKAS